MVTRAVVVSRDAVVAGAAGFAATSSAIASPAIKIDTGTTAGTDTDTCVDANTDINADPGQGKDAQSGTGANAHSGESSASVAQSGAQAAIAITFGTAADTTVIRSDVAADACKEDTSGACNHACN